MAVQRLAIITVHTSPLAPMGGKKTGGMNVYIRELAYEIGKRGIMVDIYTRRTSMLDPEIDNGLGENVRVIYLDAGPISNLPPDEIFPYLSEFTARLMAFATRHDLQYDVVYSHYWLSGWVAQKLKEAWGIPFVQMFHTLGQMKQRIVKHGFVLPDQRIATETEIVNWADRVIAATPAEHSQLLWLYRANRRKIDIIPPGVNIDRFQPVSDQVAKRELCFEPHHHVLLFVGRIEPLKAVDTILEALKVVQSSDIELLQNIRFVVVGGDPDDDRDPEMNRLKALTRAFNLEEIVCFVGAKDQAELPLYYSAATAVIMPSDYESFGMVALEAMASGTPVIASEVGGLAFLIRDSETGYLVPVREPISLANRIERMIGDLGKSKEMGQRASDLAQDYAWHRIADRVLGVLDSISRRKSQQNV
jgi:D-inositol-3-phosphate glycosyltransferase